MRVVGLKVLKNKLSEYVRHAAAGETVLITDRDLIVAELNPPAAGRTDLVSDAVLADAVRRGWLSAPTASGNTPPPSGTPIAPLRELLHDLREDRDSR